MLGASRASGLADGLATVAALGCLLLVAGLSVAAGRPLHIAPPPRGAAVASTVEPLTGQVALLHAVPALMPNGLVHKEFGDHAELADDTAVRGGLEQLATDAGAGSVMPGVFAALHQMELYPKKQTTRGGSRASRPRWRRC